MQQQASLARRVLLSALSLTLSGAALAADAPVANPLPELVGKWYGLHENVVYEVKANGDVVVVENKSTSEAVKQEKLEPGLVIARLQSHKFSGSQYIFKGQCWTVGGGKPGYSLQNCPEVAQAFYETRGVKKPYWKLSVNRHSMLRKENHVKGQGWK